jgi:hypothetical protein
LFLRKIYNKFAKKTMKKTLLLLCLCCLSFGYSQEIKQENDLLRKNELKLNAAFLIAGAFDVSYERIIDEESAIGASLFIAIESEIENKFMLTPYYRYYFGEKPATGFFAEGFGSINSYESDEWNYDYDSINNYYYSSSRYVKRTDFALGFGVGSKWITKKGFIFEINAGIGRNLFNSQDTDYDIIGKGGISFGYRFN